MKILKRVEDYRFVEVGTIHLNGMPDYRIQKRNYHKVWQDKFLLDNSIQLDYAMNDDYYMKYLCGDFEHGESIERNESRIDS